MTPGSFAALPPESSDLQIQAEQEQLQDVTPSPPNPEEVRIADEVFQEGAESHAMQGLLGLWGGHFLLQEMMAQSASKHKEEDEEALPEEQPE